MTADSQPVSDAGAVATRGASAVEPSAEASLAEVTTERMASVFAALEGFDPKWRVELGRPTGGDGWIPGDDLRDARTGLFHSLLTRMHERAKTGDRKTMAASFALRFGWAGSVAIAPYLAHGCVPRVGLDNVSIKFRDTTLFERTAVHDPRGWETRAEPGSHTSHASHTSHTDSAQPQPGSLFSQVQQVQHGRHGQGPLLRQLRRELVAQAAPVVRALQEWSGFAPRGSWGMITSSWAAQFIAVCERFGGQSLAAPILEDFFAGDDDVARMQPRTHAVTMEGVTNLYQRRASCCRYYLLPQGDLCASCPLVSQEERLRRNREFMARQLARQR